MSPQPRRPEPRRIPERRRPGAKPPGGEEGVLARLIGGLAHDLNNQLAAIQGELELAQVVPDPGRQEARLERAQHAVGRAAALVRRVLALSRGEPDPRIRVDPNELASLCAEILRSRPGARPSITLDLDPLVVPVEVQVGLIGHALSLLVTRACLSASEGGSVAVRTTTAILGASDAAARPWVAPGIYARIELSCAGHESASPPSFFDPHVADAGRGEAAREMSLVYAIVKHHRGYIHESRTAEGGTTIRIDLPGV